MPVISSLVLTNTNPVVTYTASVVTSGSIIADGLGNQITFLNISCSYANTASVQTSWEESSSYASSSMWSMSSSFSSESISSSYSNSSSWVPNLYPQTEQISSSWASSSLFSDSSSFSSESISSSWSNVSLSSSHFYPSQGSVTDAGPITGSVSASGYGFTTDVEFNNFIESISSSLQQFNTLLTHLRNAGIIS